MFPSRRGEKITKVARGMLDLPKEPLMVIASDGIGFRFEVPMRCCALICAPIQLDYSTIAHCDVIDVALGGC